MQINVPTAAPFFSGLPNQIMYCISSPNSHMQNWNSNLNIDQKKIENQHVVTTTQYYCNTTATPQIYQIANNSIINTTVNNESNNLEIKDIVEEDKKFQCSVVSRN